MDVFLFFAFEYAVCMRSRLKITDTIVEGAKDLFKMFLKHDSSATAQGGIGRRATVPFVDALLSEDPSLYDFLLGSSTNKYACLWKATDNELKGLPLLEPLKKAVQFGTSTTSNRLLKT